MTAPTVSRDDDPVSPDTIRIAELPSTRVPPVPVTADVLDVDALAWRLGSGQRIKVLCTVPDFHNPLRAALPADLDFRQPLGGFFLMAGTLFHRGWSATAAPSRTAAWMTRRTHLRRLSPPPRRHPDWR